MKIGEVNFRIEIVTRLITSLVNLVLNPKTLDIMDWYYDDKEIDGWIEVDKVTLVHISPLFLTKNLKHKYYINKNMK